MKFISNKNIFIMSMFTVLFIGSINIYPLAVKTILMDDCLHRFKRIRLTQDLKFPVDLDCLQTIRILDGTTEPLLVKDTSTNKEWVLKKDYNNTGDNLSFMLFQYLGYKIYKDLGIMVPKVKLYKDISGNFGKINSFVMLSEFIEGAPLRDYYYEIVTKQQFEAKSELKGVDIDSLLIHLQQTNCLTQDNQIINYNIKGETQPDYKFLLNNFKKDIYTKKQRKAIKEVFEDVFKKASENKEFFPKLKEQLCFNFVLNAFLGNIDILGILFSNCIVVKNKTVYYVDHSHIFRSDYHLRFTKEKKIIEFFQKKVYELNTMKEQGDFSCNFGYIRSNFSIFKDISDEEILKQMEELNNYYYDRILKTIDSEYLKLKNQFSTDKFFCKDLEEQISKLKERLAFRIGDIRSRIQNFKEKGTVSAISKSA